MHQTSGAPNKRIKGKDTFKADEVKRNERAVSMKETAGEVAKEMGRKYNTVFKKMKNIERSAGMKSGKFSAEEDQRIRMAVITAPVPRTLKNNLSQNFGG